MGDDALIRFDAKFSIYLNYADFKARFFDKARISPHHRPSAAPLRARVFDTIYDLQIPTIFYYAHLAATTLFTNRSMPDRYFACAVFGARLQRISLGRMSKFKVRRLRHIDGFLLWKAASAKETDITIISMRAPLSFSVTISFDVPRAAAVEYSVSALKARLI